MATMTDTVDRLRNLDTFRRDGLHLQVEGELRSATGAPGSVAVPVVNLASSWASSAFDLVLLAGETITFDRPWSALDIRR